MDSSINLLDIDFSNSFWHESAESSTTTELPKLPKQKDHTKCETKKLKKPKRNKSAFILFSAETRVNLKAQGYGYLNSNEMMIKIADLWRTMKPRQRQKYSLQANQDKLRYYQELDTFCKKCPEEAIKNKTRKNHVKKPCSSYAIFVRENKDVVKNEMPGLKMADILKVIAQRWKAISKEDKAVYEEKSRAEKRILQAKLHEASSQDMTYHELINEVSDGVRGENGLYGKEPVKKLKLSSQNSVQNQGGELPYNIHVHDDRTESLDDSESISLYVVQNLSECDLSTTLDGHSREKYELSFADVDFRNFDFSMLDNSSGQDYTTITKPNWDYNFPEIPCEEKSQDIFDMINFESSPQKYPEVEFPRNNSTRGDVFNTCNFLISVLESQLSALGVRGGRLKSENVFEERKVTTS